MTFVLVEGKNSEGILFMKIYWHGGNKDKIVPLVAVSKDFSVFLELIECKLTDARRLDGFLETERCGPSINGG